MDLKFLIGLKAKLIAGGIIVAVLTVALGIFKHYYDKSLTEEIKVEKLEGEVKKSEDSREGDNSTVVDNAKDKQNIDKIYDNIGKDTDHKKKKIEDEFKDTPPTPENLKEKEIKVSKVIVEGLWKSYCFRNKDNPECTKYTTE